jgi:hypothetical protein
MQRPGTTDTPVGRLGNVEVSKFEAPTGPRLRLRRVERQQAEAYFDPLELEGLTRARYKPFPFLPGRKDHEERLLRAVSGARMELLQNEFAMVGVGLARANGEERLFIRDMNAGQAIVLSPEELEGLLRARHKDFAVLIDTSDLIAIPEPDIDEA